MSYLILLIFIAKVGAQIFVAALLRISVDLLLLLSDDCVMCYVLQIVGHPCRYSTNAFSLSELLELISPIASIHFNFMIDLHWLLS